ncbi:hypothetical protein GO495_25680 [Chitinophaga oryziterrae]|uniref:Uncharacterized protein n=1 Tax=Chitinophaga oryziterrae TaxID=1031224 RepID=A0A6N8JIP0_9BACT|nr:hypothetical protein [Chitinophaga oryziterrae]MVT44012.1 hypothetical protein [Chitinophaga oryziterrae]
MRRIYYLTALLFIALFIVAFLVYTADFPNKNKNGFNRHYLQHTVTPLANISTRGVIQNICGATATQFFFATGNPKKIIATNHLLQDRKLINLPVDSLDQDFYTQVDSPAVYIYAFNKPAIITANVSTGAISKKQLPAGAFSQAHSLGNGTFILRKLSTEVPDQFFVKVTSDSISKEKHLSEIHMDGGMSTDGILHYDPETHLFTFLHYYNNNYISFDTSLQLANTGHTIDTFTHFRFELSDKDARTKHVYTSQGPDHMINAASCVYKGYLYVRSTLKADNEDEGYKNNIVIDVYNLRKGEYRGSFYLKGDTREKINKLAIYDDVLIVNCRDRIYAWDLDTSEIVAK